MTETYNDLTDELDRLPFLADHTHFGPGGLGGVRGDQLLSMRIKGNKGYLTPAQGDELEDIIYDYGYEIVSRIFDYPAPGHMEYRVRLI